MSTCRGFFGVGFDVAVGGDGQVSMGQTIVKASANKIRRLNDGRVIVGFAGATADALDEILPHMVWSHPKAASYYLNTRRRNTMTCPWRMVDHWWMTRSPDPADLRLAPAGG